MLHTELLKNKTELELLNDLDKLQYMKSECTEYLPNTYKTLLNIESELVTELQKRFNFH